MLAESSLSNEEADTKTEPRESDEWFAEDAETEDDPSRLKLLPVATASEALTNTEPSAPSFCNGSLLDTYI